MWGKMRQRSNLFCIIVRKRYRLRPKIAVDIRNDSHATKDRHNNHQIKKISTPTFAAAAAVAAVTASSSNNNVK